MKDSLSPETFAVAMQELFRWKRGKSQQEDAVHLMCETLKQLGYGVGVAVYELTLDEE